MLAGPSIAVHASRAGRGGDVVDPSGRRHDDPSHAPSSTANRVEALTGLRAVAVLLVVGTHAAYATGKLTHGYIGLVWARLEIGVPIFFVLSGFLLFGPWVKAAATGSAPPMLDRYVLRRPEPWPVVARAFSIPHTHADLHRQLPVDVGPPGSFADVEPGGGGGVLRGAAAARLPTARSGLRSTLATASTPDRASRVGHGQPDLAGRAADHRLVAELGRHVADVEMDIIEAEPLDLMVDCARNDVARRQFGARIEIGHETVAVGG